MWCVWLHFRYPVRCVRLLSRMRLQDLRRLVVASEPTHLASKGAKSHLAPRGESMPSVVSYPVLHVRYRVLYVRVLTRALMIRLQDLRRRIVAFLLDDSPG